MSGKVHHLHCEVSVCIVPAVGCWEGLRVQTSVGEGNKRMYGLHMWPNMDSDEPFNSTSNTKLEVGGDITRSHPLKPNCENIP